MAASAVCIGLSLVVRHVTCQAFLVLSMPGMAGLAVENRMIAGEIAHGGGGLIMT